VEAIIAHELAHIVVGLAADNPFTDLPRWLDEGLAMFAEDDEPVDNLATLRRAVRRDDLLSVRSMSSYPGQAEMVDLFYGEAYSVVKFLVETYGRERMNAFLGVFAEGARQEEALQRAYGFGLDELDARWRESLGLGRREDALSGSDGASVPAREPEPRQPICASPLALFSLPLVALVLGRRQSACHGT
jgi:hypothetical protein